MTIRAPEAKIDFDDLFPRTASKEFADLMLGERLGGGVARDVYELAYPPEGCAAVVKFEDVAKSFQNIIEWQVWGDVVGTKWEKWFAPCGSIGNAGVVLIQRQTKPLGDLPKRIPSFFTDLKAINWGEYEGRPVCHDYGTMSVINTKGTKMVKAVWRDD